MTNRKTSSDNGNGQIVGSPDNLLTVQDTARILGVSTDTVRRLIARGELPSFRVGSTRAIRVKKSDVIAVLTPVTAGFNARKGPTERDNH